MGAALTRRSAAAAAALLAFGGTLGLRAFFQDDQALLAANPLLQAGWRGFSGIWTTGYWEAVQGSAASVHYYRPVLMLSYWLQHMTTGLQALPYHAVNVALHVLAVLLLRAALLRRSAAPAAEAAALFFAVSPMHVEAVAAVTGRSESLAGVLVLGSWLCLEAGPSVRRRRLGLALFLLGLLTKETVFLFPLFLGLSDWVFHGQKPWQAGRRGLYGAMGLCAAAVVAARLAVLPVIASGGQAYFSSRLTAALTYSRFVWAHYLLPGVTGFGQCSDLSRPLIADEPVASPAAWLALLALAAALGGGLWAALKRRSPTGFWLAGPAFFLLPTCHLLLPLDTIGAERFLYLPLIGLAALAGAAYARLVRLRRPAALALGLGLLAWYAAAAQARGRTYRSGRTFYEAALSCNPGSARAWSSLGAALLAEGEVPRGVEALERAVRLDPALATPHYNLARLAFSAGRLREAQEELELALRSVPGDVEALVLAAVVAEAGGDLVLMRAHLDEALTVLPGHALAEFNLGRYWMLTGRPERAAGIFRGYLRRHPRDLEVQALLRTLP